MGKTCLGCGKPIGGMIGAFSVRLFYGEVCLTCNKKLSSIPNSNFLTPAQITDVISGKASKEDIVASSDFTESSSMTSKKKSSAEEIREYKGLLDDGIITQEEFETVKKRLMNT